MKTLKRKKSVHRSFSIDAGLVDQVREAVPPEIADNLNRIVTVALTELVAKYKRLDFDAQMARMARDPSVRRESKKATADFGTAESDGL